MRSGHSDGNLTQALIRRHATAGNVAVFLKKYTQNQYVDVGVPLDEQEHFDRKGRIDDYRFF
jgi:hypothetical protein